jgi:hypothetical protein
LDYLERILLFISFVVGRNRNNEPCKHLLKYAHAPYVEQQDPVDFHIVS